MVKRIAVIGNGGGGKTTISRKLGEHHGIPVCHVDSIQYQAGWKYTPVDECERVLNEIADGESWLIDGFGSRAAIERRLGIADVVVFVDFPLYQHYWWAAKRQLGSWRGSRAELPEDCPEFNWKYTRKLTQVMWEVNRDYIPWFRTLVSELPESTMLFHLHSPRQVHAFLAGYQN